MYEIETPSGRKLRPPEGRCWSTIESEFLKLKAVGRIYFGKDGTDQPSTIRYLSEVKGFIPWTWWPHDEVGHSDESRKEVQDIAKGNVIEALGSGFQFCRLSAEPLFTADGRIRPDVSFAQLAELVWFAETGTGFSPFPPKAEDTHRSPLLGVHEGRAIYLLYNRILRDKPVAGGNVLTGPVFDILPKFAGPKVIYAAANRMGARAIRENVTFKQTPYALEV